MSIKDFKKESAFVTIGKIKNPIEKLQAIAASGIIPLSEKEKILCKLHPWLTTLFLHSLPKKDRANLSQKTLQHLNACSYKESCILTGQKIPTTPKKINKIKRR